LNVAVMVHHVAVVMVVVVVAVMVIEVMRSHVSQPSAIRANMAAGMADSSLADDETALAAYAHTLVEAIEAVVGDWIRWSIADHRADLATSPEADAAVEAGSAAISSELRQLLSQDIADQTEAPLQVLRRGVRFATEVLATAEVVSVIRDDFAVKAFPDDVYGLAPATFADVDSSLHEPGLVWGAAKAHVHLRRRREAQ